MARIANARSPGVGGGLGGTRTLAPHAPIRAYYRRVAALAACLMILIVALAGVASWRERVGEARLAGTTTAAALSAPRCDDGTDNVSVVADSPQGFDVDPGGAIAVSFSCSTDRRAVERAFVLYPVTEGHFVWEGQTMRFVPAKPLLPQTRYRVTLFEGLADARGFVNGRKVSWLFITRAQP